MKYLNHMKISTKTRLEFLALFDDLLNKATLFYLTGNVLDLQSFSPWREFKIEIRI